MKLKFINIIGIAGVPAKYGGFETLVENLLNYNLEYDIKVFCSSKIYEKKIKKYKNAILHYINFKPNGFNSIIYDTLSILKSLKADAILILGISACLILPIIKIIYKGKIIINIDGLEWKRKKWNKLIKIYLLLSEYIAIKYANNIIADNYGIYIYLIKKYKKHEKKIKVIEYGADHIKIRKKKEIKKYSFYDEKYAITVCRIEPENNIHIILETWNHIKNLKLVVIGNWDNSLYGKELRRKYINKKNIYLLDAIYEQEEINYLRLKAKIYLHGHSVGGTNPSLIEAMYIGLPIFAYDCIFNRETTENSCYYWKNKGDLCYLINNTNEKELENIGKKMKEIAIKRYKWKKIAKQYFSLFTF